MTTLTIAEQAKAAQAKAKTGGNQQITHVVEYDKTRWEDLANLIAAQVPGIKLNTEGIAKAGMSATGDPTVLCALKRERGGPKCSATLYSSGKAVFAGMQPISLDDAPKAPRPRARKPKPTTEPAPERTPTA